MTRAVLWSRDALEDLKQTLGYIAERNPAAAHRIGSTIRAAGNELAAIATGRRGRVIGTYEKVARRTPYILADEIGPLPDGREFVPCDPWREGLARRRVAEMTRGKNCGKS